MNNNFTLTLIAVAITVVGISILMTAPIIVLGFWIFG